MLLQGSDLKSLVPGRPGKREKILAQIIKPD